MMMDEGTPPADAPMPPDDAGCATESTWVAQGIFSTNTAFRAAARELTAALLRRAGVDAFDWVEDAVQDAFAEAARSWSSGATPRSPMAWLHQVAYRRYLDRVRAAKRVIDAPAALDAAAAPLADASDVDTSLAMSDDVLRLLFMCSHPALTEASRLALTLKCVSQVEVDNIARLLRSEPTAVAQRIVRAKRTLQAHRATFAHPDDATFSARLDDVLQVVYALFTDGHHAADGDTLVHVERCEEALRLVSLIAHDRALARPAVHALHALVLLTAARQPARTTEGVAVPLDEQDRSRWHRPYISQGLAAFGRSIGGDRVTRYHLEAEIALLHTTAPTWAATPWAQIVDAYDRLLRLEATPMAQLARVVALSESGRREDALAAHTALAGVMDRTAEWHAVGASLAMRTGDWRRAIIAYDAALAHPQSGPARAHLEQRRQRCQRALDEGRVAPIDALAHPSPP